jgi:hypothetical protein
MADSVAKLDEGWLARNTGIVAMVFLNQYCGLVAILESILLAQTPKIVLQRPYRGENSGPGEDDRGELDTQIRN